MDLVEVRLPIHDHPMTPLKDGRKGNCCGIKFEAISEGYYCSKCDEFFHMSCSNAPKEINHSFHKCDSPLELKYHSGGKRCGLCREKVESKFKVYTCSYWNHVDSVIHLDCFKYPPPKMVKVPQNHDHTLSLVRVIRCFTCSACGEEGDGCSYTCHECHLNFHVNCVKYGAEVTHPSHLHPLKYFIGEPPAYTDGKCSLCGERLSEAFYHCFTCNFTLDLHCVHDPPQPYLRNQNTHDHKLTLLPKLFSFTCTTCGLNGDRSPYVCLQCNFISHNDCSGFPWVIDINRHGHRVSRTSLLGVVDAVCGVCQKKMDWSCGGYACQRCPSSVYHTKCATRKDVSDGIDMKDQPEYHKDIEPFEVIDENTIHHFLHKEHHLRLDKTGIFIEERGVCEACAYPIYHDYFYSCRTCNYILHESCANLPQWKWHVLSNRPYRLFPTDFSKCLACGMFYSGCKYVCGFDKFLDMRCASVSEPFVHQSHPHPLYYTTPQGVCSACKKKAHHVLRCVEENCKYILDFKCATLPYVVKHRVDDHFLSLCYGEDNEHVSGKYWCDICEQQTDPKFWFYTCKDCGVTLHIHCVLGDSRGLGPGSKVSCTRYGTTKNFKVVLNNSMSRPHCSECKIRCLFPVMFKRALKTRNIYYCSVKCCDLKEQ